MDLKNYTFIFFILLSRLNSSTSAQNLLDFLNFDSMKEKIDSIVATEDANTEEERETIVLNKQVNQDYTFQLSNRIEYYVKFEIPDSVIEEFEQDPEKHTFQVNAGSLDAEERHPVDITVRQLKRIISFQLPHVERESERLLFRSPEKSVDFCPLSKLDKNATVIMTIATSSRKEVHVAVRVLIKGKHGDWTKNGDVYETNTTITPTISRIRYFNSDLVDSKYLRVKVKMRNRSDCLCSIISIQDPKCPFYDTIGAAQRFGRWATMLNFTTIIIDKRDYPNGFIIVFVASATDDLCNIVQDENRCHNFNANVTNPRKRLNVQIEANGSEATYAGACMTIIASYGVIALVTITISIIEFKYNYQDFQKFKVKMTEMEAQFREEFNKFGERIVRRMSEQSTPTKSKLDGYGVRDGLENTIDPVVGPISTKFNRESNKEVNTTPKTKEPPKPKESVDENLTEVTYTVRTNPEDLTSEPGSPHHQEDNQKDGQGGMVEDYHEADYAQIATAAELKGTVFQSEDEVDEKVATRLKTDLRIPDLCKKLDDPTRSKSIYQKSELYLGIALLISLYYSLPVLQMVFTFSANQRNTGNQDICYYNDLCRKPVSIMRDFNHVFSNLGYMVFGALFMFLVFLKKWKYNTFLRQNRLKEREYGVPQQYGLYFSMGLALFMEGVMSGSYHVCPTNITFQFDTTFMYLISILMFLKLYQVRHADVSANAVGVFFGLGVSLILETISIIYSGPWFWLFFCLVYVIVIVVAVVHGYNLGIVRYDYKILYNVARILWLELNKIVSIPGHPAIPRVRSRLVCLSCMASVNLLLCIYFAASRTSGASNYLLAIYILNLAMYFSYYCIMKVKHGERINKVPTLYSFLSMLCVIPALYFFTQIEKKTEISPAESRMLNTECIFLDFFDGHDIWHFLGGSGLFFAFLTILTLDEDLKYKRRKSIAVF